MSLSCSAGIFTWSHYCSGSICWTDVLLTKSECTSCVLMPQYGIMLILMLQCRSCVLMPRYEIMLILMLQYKTIYCKTTHPYSFILQLSSGSYLHSIQTHIHTISFSSYVIYSFYLCPLFFLSVLNKTLILS